MERIPGVIVRRAARWLAVAALLAISYAECRHWIGNPLSLGVLDIVTDPVDTPMIAHGLAVAPTFGDTLAWWHGPWAGTNAFFRPIPSCLWWTEFRLTGLHKLHVFLAVHALLHLLISLALVLWLARMLGWRRAVAATFLFASCLLITLGLPHPGPALMSWKDDPDLLVTLFGVLFLCSYHARIDLAAPRRLAVPFVWFALALCTKEMGVVMPLLLLCVLWYLRRLDRRRDVIAFLALEAVYAVYRTHVLHGFGYRFGTNGAWLDRWFANVVAGGAAMAVRTLNWEVLALVCMVMAAITSVRAHDLRRHLPEWRRALLGLGLWGGGTVVGLIASMRYSRLSLVEALTAIAMVWAGHSWSAHGARAGAALAIGAGYSWMYRRGDRAAWFGWLWQAVAYVPLMTAPILEHGLYLPSIGWAIWGGALLVGLGERLLARSARPNLTHAVVAGPAAPVEPAKSDAR